MRRRGIIYINEHYAEYGIFESDAQNIRIYMEGQVVWGISYEALKDSLGFDYAKGIYVLGLDTNLFSFPFGRDLFPYNLDRHIYNTKFNEHLFKNKQKYSNFIEFKYINELPYTFGLEFETAGGYLPQHQLYELGLIPLRDGSITGIEFATVVLQGNQGLNLLKQQLEVLDKHTIFDKDCSLHIHFGGMKLSGEVLLSINNLFCGCCLEYYLPPLTFQTNKYKTNQDKNYCALNTKFKSFEDLYYSIVGRPFYGDFYQPHPKDQSGTRKWNITSRYKAVNFVNALCYSNPKTVEFRILRPTYNFDKILGWLFIFGAIIKYAEQNPKGFVRQNVNIAHIVQSVYSSELASILCTFLNMNKSIIEAQTNIGDFYGMRIDIDDKVINYQSFGKHFY